MSVGDWIATASVIVAVASLIVAAIAAWAVERQAYLLRFSIQVQSLLTVDQRFNDRDQREKRHHAARQLFADRPDAEVEDVLDFLDTLGTLVRRGALDAEMVWATFFYWIYGYWDAAGAVIGRERSKNRRVWEDLADLYARVLAIENRKGRQKQEERADFLEYEVQQFHGEEGAAQ